MGLTSGSGAQFRLSGSPGAGGAGRGGACPPRFTSGPESFLTKFRKDVRTGSHRFTGVVHRIRSAFRNVARQFTGGVEAIRNAFRSGSHVFSRDLRMIRNSQDQRTPRHRGERLRSMPTFASVCNAGQEKSQRRGYASALAVVVGRQVTIRRVPSASRSASRRCHGWTDR